MIVRGIAKDAGVVSTVPLNAKEMAVVVIARTNKGLVAELLGRRAVLGRWPRWALVDEEGTKVFDVTAYEDL
eukprot:3460862-Rhodomonas_salina.1